MNKLYNRIRLITIVVMFLVFSAASLHAQVKIGLPAGAAAASAILDVSNTGGTNKGFLAPQVALTALNAAGPVTAPATGLLVYNTATAGTSPNNVVPGFYYWNGTQWVMMVVAASSTSGGNIYSNDGTLAANRTVTMAGNPLNFAGGTLIFTPQNVTAAMTIDNGAAGKNPRVGTLDTLELQSGGNAYQVALLPSGNVGIGTNAPGTRLRVQGSVSTNYATPNDCACVVSGNSNIPVTVSHFTMFDANFSTTASLPAGATEGQLMVISNGATLTYTLSTTNTSLAAALTVTNGQAYQFVYVGSRWLRLL